MIEPKLFYRQMDELLANIGDDKGTQNFLFSLLKKLENSFGDTLYLTRGRLYEEKGDEFALLHSSDDSGAVRISTESEDIQLVLTHGSYIFENGDVKTKQIFNKNGEFSMPVAFAVRSPHQRWIFVFDLKSGWIREEVSFCINIMRTAVNYRLLSESIGHTMEQARQIQQTLLPEGTPQIPGFQIAARSQSAEVIGGDFYDLQVFENSQFGFSVGDASGHGLPAALLIRDVVTGLRLGMNTDMKMVPLLKNLNKVIQRNTYSARFVSLFYGEIENDGHLIYVNAGHVAPIFVSADQVQELQSTGLVLGAVPDVSLYRSYARLVPNSVLVLYTDGIVEREDRDENTFGISQLKELVLENQNKTAQEILELIFKKTFDFGKGTKWQDDATVLVIKKVS